MGNNAGNRDTLSSGKRGYRKMLAKEADLSGKEQQNAEQELIKSTCPKKADPKRFSLGL